MIFVIKFVSNIVYAKISFDATVSQKKVVENLSEYLSSPDYSSIFILNGYAGTGKTTLIAALVQVLRAMNIPCVLLAPTGRAAKVLAQYSGTEAHTIHKRIYRQRTNADYESKYSLDINREKGCVFIVDETSMLSDSTPDGQIFGSGSLLEDLITYVRSGRQCRLILVGDDAQLPPVGADRSPALDAAAMRSYGEVVYSSMTDVVRQDAASGILNYPDIESIGGGEFLECLEDAYARYGRDETIVITRSNKRANRFNEGIRRYILSAEEQIESGDRLMVVKNNYYYTERMEKSPMSFIANGDIALLKRIRRFEDFYGFHFADAVLSFGDYGDTEIECKILLDTLSSESPSLTREQSRQLFDEVEKDYMDTASRLKRFRQIRENPHYNALQVKFAYAVTCHKAQGGQWRAVFVDRCLFGDEPMTRDMLRWLYTAVTRATEKLYLVNFDERFFE